MPAPRPMTPRPFVIRKSSIAGKGAFATRRIPKGARVVEYTGERISQEEADRRYPYDPDVPHHTFLFNLEDDVVVDAAHRGNASRFINHSCDPNCEAVIEDGRIWIYAKKAIQPGAELAYDYQYERTAEHTEEDEAFYRCLCGSPKCRGTILAPKKKPRRASPKKASPKKASPKKASPKKAQSAKKAAKAAKRSRA